MYEDKKPCSVCNRFFEAKNGLYFKDLGFWVCSKKCKQDALLMTVLKGKKHAHA